MILNSISAKSVPPDSTKRFCKALQGKKRCSDTWADQNKEVLETNNSTKKPIWPPYLKDLLVQNPGAEHSDALCVDDSPVASGQRPGHLLLTVHKDGDSLLLNTDGHAVPSGQGGRTSVHQ